jgi:hypothetical protein
VRARSDLGAARRPTAGAPPIDPDDDATAPGTGLGFWNHTGATPPRATVLNGRQSKS